MLKPSDETAEAEGPELGRLIERLRQDARDWAVAELALARLELAGLKVQAIRAGIFAAVAFAALICFLMAMTVAAIALLAPHAGGAGVAALVVAVLLGCAFTASLLGLRRAVAWRRESIFFRWPGGA